MRTSCWICGLIYFALVAQMRALEIAGKVESVSGETARVTADGDLVPNAGDKVDIFFKMAGLDEEIAVANGKVAEVDADGIKVRIDEATGTVQKDQLVRITSEHPQKKLIAPPAAASIPTSPAPPAATVPASSAEPTDLGQMASRTVNFNQLPTGPLALDAFASEGLRLQKGKGEPGVYALEPNMRPPAPCQKVMLLGGERVTAFTILLDPPAKRFALYRIGTANGASVPTWKMTAYSAKGKSLGSTGETHGLPAEPKDFGVDAEGIARVEITTDNRYGSGTWATWNSLPIANFSFNR